MLRALLLLLLPLAASAQQQQSPPSLSGIHPGLAMYNDENECGTGAVVPFADRLWVITYAPHKPQGSSDKLYEITPELRQIVRPESIGGTPANRFLHRETKQLFIGPYVIAPDRTVRTITPKEMFGRLTGNARHLTDPAGKVYYATMEEGLYEVDVRTLAVTELWADEQRKTGRHGNLPGYHGKGLYSGQGRIVYANNGDHAREALKDPAVPSGVLASWDGRAEAWEIIRRNQFTDVTGPGGIHGADHPESDPIWSIGWDHRSLILMLLDRGKWHSFRLPKGSHSYDGAHGWNTEWPRIREIGEGENLLMTMHGTFWRFPKGFRLGHTAGLAPRSNYLKVIGDFCRWGDRLVMGCDDSARSEFLNKRRFKGALNGPGQSHSNLWFVEPAQLDRFGPALGAGAVWLREPVQAHAASEPFLFAGYARRGLHLATGLAEPVTIALETDDGSGTWRPLRTVEVTGYRWIEFPAAETGAWIRLEPSRDLPRATAVFHFSNADERPLKPAAIFDGLASPSDSRFAGGRLLARGGNLRTLGFAATSVVDGGVTEEYLELDAALRLRPSSDAAAHEWVKKHTPIPAGVLQVEEHSVLAVDDRGRRWRLPKTDPAYDRLEGELRVCREVCTERDLFQAHGTFYELPAENAGGFAKMRPVATHGRAIRDYASYRGLLLLTGIAPDAPRDNAHIIRAGQGGAALWAGTVDDLWQLGKPAGHGGPWNAAAVAAGDVSDPYLFRGYDRKRLELSATGSPPARVTVELDLTGEGDWHPYETFTVTPGQSARHDFPRALGAYWLRLRAETASQVTAELTYD
jgi:hypothetical protein